ncbi:MAG TPA: ABC transporter permease [Anaerolineales bacterium]|nr:ABC transporter permease [Anaerolineales bacterium]
MAILNPQTGVEMDRDHLPLYSLTRRTLLAEMRALLAVVRREWIIFRRYPSWIVALLVWPIIFPMVYIFSARALAGPDGGSLSLFAQLAGTEDYLGYIAIGTTVWMWQNVVLWDVGFALRAEQMRGTLETNWLTPTWRFSYLLGNSFVQLFSMLLFLLISVIEFALLFGVRLHGNPWLVILMVIASMPAIYGLGFAFASLVITAKEANTFVFLVRGLVMIFCGITFPIAILPEWMQAVSRWLPQSYMIRGVRNAALAGADLKTLMPDIQALLLFGLAWLSIGYVLFHWMERQARKTGTIGHY